eukprot:1340832-Pyramimonas_sp.AAC.2
MLVGVLGCQASRVLSVMPMRGWPTSCVYTTQRSFGLRFGLSAHEKGRWSSAKRATFASRHS